MKVVVYSTPTCAYCYQAKEFFARRGIPFVEKNVAADRKAAMEMVRISGQQGVPVIVVDGEVVIGFNQPRLRQLLERAKPKLGASVADAASQAKKQPGIPAEGAYVGQVHPGTPAARAGLRPRDVITALGGQPIISAHDLHRLVSQLPAGRDVSLTYVRDGAKHDSLIRL
ncbi:MAG: Uxx-star family glutaredoxin-like (seleno)protein [Anaerolineae bacterium]